jgi:hypothetical protein
LISVEPCLGQIREKIRAQLTRKLKWLSMGGEGDKTDCQGPEMVSHD